MRSLRNAILAIIISLPPLTLASQDFPLSYSSLGAEVGYVDAGTSGNGGSAEDDLSNDWEFGLNFTHQFNPNISLLLQGSYAEPETRNLNLDVELWRGSIGGRLHPTDYRLAGWRPFAGGGYSHSNLDTDLGSKNEDMLYLEGGLHRMVSPRFLAEAGVRGRLEVDDDYIDGQVFAGIHYVFGRKFPAAPRPRQPLDVARLSTPPADTDGDGVEDARDRCPNTPEGALVDEAGCARELTREIKQTLYVEFEHDRTEVRPAYYPEIGKLARVLKQYPTARILLEGHTDSTGPASYNQRLSKSRADAVMKVLVSQFNISAERIRTSGMGESQPIASNDTAEGRARNRRVEAIVFGTYSEIMKKTR